MKKIFFTIITLSCIYSCIDPINLLNSENSKTMLVIDARMVKFKDKGSVFVDLIQSSFNTDRSFGYIADEVSVVNASGAKLVLDRTSIGRYSAVETPAFKFTYGDKYKIRVFNNNGEVYESAFEELTPTPAINKTSFKYTGPSLNKENNLFVSVNTTVSSGQKNKILKWDVSKTYLLTDQAWGAPLGKKCYITDKVDKLQVVMVDGGKVENNKPIDLVVTEKIADDQFAEGTYFTVVQEAIDLKTQNYFTAYNNLVQREGNIFETPPGSLPTNFLCISDSTKLVTGFFYAVQQDTARIYIDPSDVGSPARLCPVPPNEASDCPIPHCCNCLRTKGSSTSKPSFWR